MLTVDEHELSFVNGKDIRYFFLDAFLFGPDRFTFRSDFAPALLQTEERP